MAIRKEPVPQRGRRTLETVWEDDTSSLEVAVYLVAVGAETVYRSDLVPGAAAGVAIALPIDFALVYDAADDPLTAPAIELPVGTYGVEIVAGKYDPEGALPYDPVGFKFEVLDYAAIDEPA